MTTLQIILISIGGLITLFFVFAFFLPSEKELTWSIEINSPAKKVYTLVTDFSNYKKWNPWSAKEPDAHGEMSGEANTIGHKWLWDGKIIGRGYLQITDLKEAEFAKSNLVFETPRKMEGLDIWTFQKIDENTTKVSWGHKAYLDYPVGRVFGLMLEKMLGKDFEQGLQSLKNLSESSTSNE